MNPFKTLAESYKRLRHTRGYGVHSPFAFSMLDNIYYHRGYCYYAETEIENSVGHKHALQFRRCMILHRLVARYSVCAVYVDCSCPDSFMQAIKLADSGLRFTSDIDKSDLIIDSNGELSAEEVIRLIPGRIILIFNPSDKIRILRTTGLTSGLMLYGKNSCLLAYRPKMRFTSYSIRL